MIGTDFVRWKQKKSLTLVLLYGRIYFYCNHLKFIKLKWSYLIYWLDLKIHSEQ